MTPAWILSPSRTLGMRGSTSARARRQHRSSPSLENLEHRLSLSGFTTAPADLNPQPLPPGWAHVDPMVQGGHIGANALVERKH